MRRKSLQIAPFVGQLARLRALLEAELQDLDATEGPRPAIVVAASELFVNACEHGGVHPGTRVRITTCRMQDEFEFTMRYQGVRFEPPPDPHPEPEALQAKGLGLYIARRLVDHLGFEPSRAAMGMQTIRFSKRLR